MVKGKWFAPVVIFVTFVSEVFIHWNLGRKKPIREWTIPKGTELYRVAGVVLLFTYIASAIIG